MNFEETPRARDLRERISEFFSAKILPRHREWHHSVVELGKPPAFLEPLRKEARKQGLWNLALNDPAHMDGREPYSNVEFAPACEIMGRLPWASQVFNCHAPELPNMLLLEQAGNLEQKARWLKPLTEGTMRSAFALTEPDFASSDATNVGTRIDREGDTYRINGRKWFITGAAHPDCRFVVVVGRSHPDNPRTSQHTAVIVPMDTPGVRVVRPLRFMGWEDHVAPVGELEFVDVRVPVENRIGEEGFGFQGSQARLGPARLHHCMRLLGQAEVMVEMMMARARERSTFGRRLVEYDTIQRWIAESRVEIELSRTILMKTAWEIDQAGHKGSWRSVSISKVAVPQAVQRIADKAIQVFGAMGGSDDILAHHALAYARILRIGDGPDEVHLRQLFRTEDVPSWPVADCPYVVGPSARPIEA
ncbi:acyl-CoA dehydrogenase family protein [Ottowia sp. VDI28]|uniref:acyl-CoA dehydrogenase family protein n=1 Tax=Ottowia sp. VDI28 TaxID=3133968 RepID=UPI003C2C7338